MGAKKNMERVKEPRIRASRRLVVLIGSALKSLGVASGGCVDGRPVRDIPVGMGTGA